MPKLSDFTSVVTSSANTLVPMVEVGNSTFTNRNITIENLRTLLFVPATSSVKGVVIAGSSLVSDVNGILNVKDPVPSQDTHTGKFLTTNGSTLSWGTVAYANITGKPTIPVVPTNLSDFTNDTGYITASQVTGGSELVNGSVTTSLESSGQLVLDPTLGGRIKYYGDYVAKTNGWGIVCAAGVDTVIITSAVTNVRTMKLLVQIEGEDGDGTGYHSQATDMIVTRRVSNTNATSVDATVYGGVYTSAASLVTLDARWNGTSGLIEVIARPTSLTTSVDVKVFSVETSYYD